ncbi:GGDEF domain-containing protein [Arcobacter suis]|uniref:PAS sensor-containing diguanylate cyclase/phosphodiesterase n=1 Tax=Arcobacter suis CECT 7833 TaxID=663365 RepID=A0AAD0SRN4_9BACT|nr:EAL domain-containing protein [Arcobacter suis]AXX90428.1 PAS sensor-containing diguanylate cyclase/phosphodiesterase [Arcobacter suis CECT 7833]RWS45672.1 GGDEF domain-containing protein [Arcobacter suis]
MDSTLIQPDDFLKLISKHLPDMLWAKDLDGRYLYANDAICNKLLMATPQEVIGKNDVFFAQRERAKHPENKQWHTFGELCFNSDTLVLDEMKPMIFEEYGNIKGELVYLEVNKAPLQDVNGKLIGTIGSGRDITSQVLLEKKNEKLAFYDQLTLLPNRQKILLDISLKNPTACVIFNIDEFKVINDFFGMESGDKILQDISKWFLRLDFETYRIDGDEFAILYYEDIPIENIKHNIENLLSLFEEELFHIEDETIHIQLSAGIAKVKDKLLTKADIAINYAREQKIKVSVYEENANIEEKYKHNIAIATSIREALLDNRIICHYQPIIDIETSKIAKYETLVRMIDKNNKIIPPLDFLKIAKKTKLYSHITKEVVHQSCNMFKNRKESFSVNLSIDDIKDPNTVQEIINTIIKTNTASRIVFEILESEGIENYDEVANFIVQVKSLGAKIAIDDFGTGYSNFEHILRLNIDYIKIDGSLIKNIQKDKKHRIIVETIVDFAKKTDSKTVAEFVSDERIFSIIKEIGVDFSQGFYTGKPQMIN